MTKKRTLPRSYALEQVLVEEYDAILFVYVALLHSLALKRGGEAPERTTKEQAQCFGWIFARPAWKQMVASTTGHILWNIREMVATYYTQGRWS
jgi:hypothetical protein